MWKNTANIIAASLLFLMFVLAITSLKYESLTMDEVSHLPAGYSYVTQKDMRINPEHPPLIKDLAGLPLLFIDNIKFPSDIKAWKDDTNGQWDYGFYFLYNTGNPADQMIFWGRIPLIFLLIFLAFFVFKWAKERYGNKTALLALFFFSFSPTLLAHGRLVTTDVGAAAGAFIAAYYFLKALQSPNKKNIVIAGIAFGLAELLKFSVILLVPLFGFLSLIWWLLKSGTFFTTLKTLVFVFAIGALLIWPIYQYHVWNYPPEMQVRDTKIYLSAYPDSISNALVFAADKPILRPYAQYLTGLLMVFNRATGGNTTYFLGEISNLGWKNYFPTVYAIKEPLAFHLLTLIALIYLTWTTIKKQFWKNTCSKLKDLIKSRFPEFAMISFVGLYWMSSLTSNLNIGIRHLLPVFPFTILLVSAATAGWLKEPYLKAKYVFLAMLVSWQALTVLSVYPHFLAYFNELIGGPKNGYKYVVDSNLDWGQDLKRLKMWTDEEKISKVYVSYFGGSSPEYYLKDKYLSWWGDRNPAELPKGSYLAVSATLLQGGRGKPAPGFIQPTGQYLWLNQYEPIARIGYSIFVYRID